MQALWLALILAASFAVACGVRGELKAALPCLFVPVEDDSRDRLPRCARRDDDGRWVIEPGALRVRAARGEDLAVIELAGELHYLNAAGVVVPVLPFDNGADPFVEGLARTSVGGKIGFIDESLRVVIPATWTFAFPFENGRAVVCEGCELHDVGDGHREVVGGRWGAIDRNGEVVVPVIHTRENLPKP